MLAMQHILLITLYLTNMNKDSLIEKDGIVKTVSEWSEPTQDAIFSGGVLAETINEEVFEDSEVSEEETPKKKIVKIKKT